MSDPLSLIRQATINNSEVKLDGENYIVGGHVLPAKTETAFKRTLKSDDFYYTVRDVIFFLQNATESVAKYRQDAVKERINPVVTTDRHILLDYLQGNIETCPQIDQNAVANYNNANNANDMSSFTAQFSLEQMREQREKHAALIEKTVQKSKPTTIETKQSTSGMAIAGLPEGKLQELRQLRRAQKRKSVEVELEDENFDKAFMDADAQLLARLRTDEVPSHTRSTVLCTVGMDFKVALKLFNERVLKPRTANEQKGVESRKDRPSSKLTAVAKTPINPATGLPSLPQRRPLKEGPIIIVPSSVTSYVTLYNIEDLLIRGEYIATSDKKKEVGVLAVKELKLERTKENGRKAVYTIIDDPTKLLPEEWNQVIAVFATGQEWQFKGWKYSQPVELFQRVLGIHMCMEDQAPHENISAWNCKVMRLNRFKQHINAGVARQFWLFVEDFMRIHVAQFGKKKPSASGQISAKR